MNGQNSVHRRMTAKDIILMSIESILFVAQVATCVLAYNFHGLTVVVYLGWALLVAACILGWRARAALEEKGKHRENESWLRTRAVVWAGPYGLVRHPMYLSFALISLALVCLSQHWSSTLMGVCMMGLLYNDMRREEQGTIEKLGNDYRRYMEQVPRVNLFLGIVRHLRRRQNDE